MALWEERRDHEMAVRRNVEAEQARYDAWDGKGVCPECHDERFVAAGSHTARCPTCSDRVKPHPLDNPQGPTQW